MTGRTTELVQSADVEQVSGYARALGVPVPPARRLPTEHDVRGSVSGLVFGFDPRLVFLHGGQLNAHSWDGVILRTAVPAIAYDLPGHGHSLRLAPAGYTTAAIAQLIATRILVDTAQDIVLVGHSYGAMVGALVAAMLGRRVTSLVMLDATPHRIGTAADDPETRQVGTVEELVDSVHARFPERRRESVFRSVALNTRRRDDGRCEWLWDPHFRDSSPGRLGDRDVVWEALTCLQIPMTLVMGERSGKVDSEMLDEFRQRLPGARILTAPGAGHHVHSDAPAWTADLLRSLLAS